MTDEIKLPKKLVLWGHSLDEYKEMFALEDEDLNKKFFDCCPGAASFNLELTQHQGQVVSCDELYKSDLPTLSKYLNSSFSSMLELVKQHKELFIWDKVKSLDNLQKKRREGMDSFLNDYNQGKADKRYISQDIQSTNFSDTEFDMALCSHFLFGHREEHNLEFHLAVISELCRIANEVRIFPLLDKHGEISPLVGPVLLALQQNNFGAEVRQVPYHLQQNDNAMLRIWPQSCDL